MTPRCDACAFWRISDDPARSGHEWDPDDKQGTCRRHAPQPWNSDVVYEMLKHLTVIAFIAEITHSANDEADEKKIQAGYREWEAAASEPGLASWPGTTGADWCGEFKPKEAV